MLCQNGLLSTCDPTKALFLKKSPFQAVLGGKEQLGVGSVVTEMGMYYSYFN